MDNRTEGIGMEFNETQTMAINFTKMAKEKMGDKVKDFLPFRKSVPIVYKLIFIRFTPFLFIFP